MGLRRALSLLSALLLVTACATSTTRMNPAERLEFYRANSGEPVRSFNSPSRLWGWRAVGDSALTVWTNSNRGYLLELSHRCPDLTFASSVGLTTRTGRVSAGFDSVVVPRSGTQGGVGQMGTVQTTGPQRNSASMNRTTCRIATIRPLNTRVVKEPKRELQDADILERDASEPSEPAEPAEAAGAAR
jgi:Family of unknown function (DUF6491)